METHHLIDQFLRLHHASSHPQFLVAAYEFVFGRGLDEQGYNNCLAQLYAGRPRRELLREWLQSAEFVRSGRVLPALPQPSTPQAPPPSPSRDQLEQYQDIWIRGRCVQPGRRECAQRFALVAEFCRQYQRPFTVLDLGANLAYFSIRLAETFPQCTAVACEGIYGEWTREVLEQNDNPHIILLHHTFRLADLRALAEVEHFDVILALSVVHHLDGPFAESLSVLRSLGDHLILELPTETDACGQPIVEEIRQASLPANAQLLGHGQSHLGGSPRPIYLLSQPKTRLTKSYLGTPRTGLQVTIESDFQRKRIRFHNKPEQRDWLPGINLHTYLWFHGCYPRHGWIADALEVTSGTVAKHRDIQPWNVILGHGTARLIDADDPNHAFDYTDDEYRQRLIHILRLADAAQLSPRHPSTSLPVRWCGPVFNPSGYASEAINFLIPLAKRVTLGLEHHNNIYSESFVRGLPVDERRTLLALRERYRYLQGGILIAHNPAPGFRELPDAVYRIGRTMFETDRIPADWVTACNRMDEIWVPSRFNVETFTRAGVEPDLLHVIPEAVDHEVFDPARHEPLPLPNRAAFNFLAVFEWSSRKAWDVLLSAYLREFSAEDDVCLYLRTYLFGQPDDDPRAVLWQRICEHAATLGLGNKPWPRIELLTEQVPAADLPRLYRAVDCLVAPSRGEGWGRPQHEAMLMELPVIATNWSAPADFMTNEVAYLLEYELVDIRVVEPELWHYRGHRWANPSESHLRQLMRHVQQHPDEARARGRAARAHMVRHYNRETVADLIVKRLIEIERRLTSAVCPPAPTRSPTPPVPRPRRETPPTIRIAWQGATGRDAGSLAHVNRQLIDRLARVPGIRLKSDRPNLTVRHQWPPDWTPPARGAFVIMQPWEYGHIPADWVEPLQRVDAVWTPSTYARRCFIASGIDPAKVQVVPNGIDPQRYRPGIPPRGLPTGKSFKFLFVGGTIYRKGIDLLLRAWRETFTAQDDVCLVIKDFGRRQFYAGQTAEQEIRAAGAAGGAEILYLDDEWPDDQLPGLYTACDCLVHPYRGEGFGLPVLEAMACGLPVIVTGGGATDDFATDEFAYRLPARRLLLGGQLGDIKLAGPGWLLEPDLESLKHMLRHVVTLRDEARARGHAASEHVRQHWTWEHAAKTAAEYARVLLQEHEARARAPRPTLTVSLPADALKQPPPPLPAAPCLTVCVITRNEETNLPRCLHSVRALADQIVVLDTGSTDRTREVARDLGAEVHEFTWCDDFSAARNAALRHARGDWVLMLDADEELTDDGRAALPAELRDAQVVIYRLPLIEAGKEDEGVHYVPRLFRNIPGIAYIGRVHEQLWPTVEPLRRRWKLQTRFSRAMLRHHGYDAATRQRRQKTQRNLFLLQRALEEHPDDPNLWMNLGLELAHAGHNRAALDAYLTAWQAVQKLSANECVPEFRETLLVQLTTALLTHRRWEMLERVLESALARAAPLSASLLYLRGLARWQRGQYETAAEDFTQCIARRGESPIGPVHRDVHGAAPYHCLAVCRQRLHQPDEAAAAFEEAIARAPQSAPLRRDYAEFLVERGLPVDALRQLHAALTCGGDDLVTWRRGGEIALEYPALWEFACDWTAEAYRHHPHDGIIRQQRATALLATGQLDAALAIWKTAASEENASRQFLLAYRHLLRGGCSGVLATIHRDMDRIAAVLPTAAHMLRHALAEAAA